MSTWPLLLLSAIVLWPLLNHAAEEAPASPTATNPPALKTNAEAGGLFYLRTNGLTIRLEPKAIADGGAFGFDYLLEYEPPHKDADGVAKTTYGLQLSSRGFISTEPEENQDSLISQVGFDGYFCSRTQRLSKEEQGRIDEILRKSDDPFNLPQDLQEEYDSLMHGGPRRFATFNAHVKHETDQSFENYNLAGGVGIASDIGVFTGDRWLDRVFDFPFALTRKNPRIVMPGPRFYVGYDFVDASQNEARAATTDDDTFHRLAAQVAWSTQLFDFVEVRVLYQAYYELSASAQIEDAGKDLTSFVELTAAVPVDSGKKKKIFVKYTDGDLPPRLQRNSTIALGFSVELGGNAN